MTSPNGKDLIFKTGGIMSVPCYCPTCNNLFTSRMIHMEDSSNITFTGGSEPCSRCGSRANILDGTYNSFDGVLEVVNGSNFTKYAVKELQNIAMDMYYNKKSMESSLDDIEKIDPELGGKMKRFAQANVGTQVKYLIIFTIILVAYQYSSGFLNKAGQLQAESLFGDHASSSASENIDKTTGDKKTN